jgi:16S rRNA (guanine527-N7)-methyltransferase
VTGGDLIRPPSPGRQDRPPLDASDAVTTTGAGGPSDAWSGSPALVDVLEEAARLGLLGPGSVAAAVGHAARFAVGLRPARRVLDLGSGAGVPGLVMADRRPDLHLVLLDGRGNRADFLRRAVSRLGWGDRVEVLGTRAETAGHDPQWRGQLDAVVARSFGSPAVTAECAAPFLRTGGQLLVSEPPDPTISRWPAAGLALLGLERDAAAADGLASFTQVEPAPARFPRRRQSPSAFNLGSP